MRTRWECLYEAFDRVVRRADERAFMNAAASYDALAAFDNLQELYAFLLERSEERDARDRVLAALVQLARDCDDNVVSALLWLALWPGLCNVYRRRLRRGWDADDVISAIALAFTVAAHELDVTRVRRVAATLVRNTERRVTDLQRADREKVGREDLLELAAHRPALPDPTVELRLLQGWLATAVGSDGDLLLRVVALGETKAEAAKRLGLTAAAAHKRFHRAVTRLRAEEADVALVAGACA